MGMTPELRGGRGGGGGGRLLGDATQGFGLVLGWRAQEPKHVYEGYRSTEKMFGCPTTANEARKMRLRCYATVVGQLPAYS